LSVAFRSTDVSALPARNRGEAILATDGELLMRFVRQRDHAAYAQIVERHGRLVWMICQQVLRHHQDVEDAFQATFLILAERAQSIRASDSASAWLFGVAQRTALAARRKRFRRREESLVDEPPVGEESVRAIDNREMLYVLLREIDNLPARYQTPLVMRYLEGQSRRAIAEQTDSTVGQIQGRLVRGRRLLRSRLFQRGVSLSLAAGAVAGTAASAEAAVTPALIDSTAETCLQVKTSGTMNGLPPVVLELVREGVKAMWVTFAAKCGAIVSAAALTAGIVWAAQQGGQAGDAGTKAVAKKKSDLQVVAGKGAVGDNVSTVDFTAGASQPADYVKFQNTSRLQNRIQEACHDLDKQMDEKVEKTARLEMDQLEKAELQRKAEHWQGWLAELDTPVVNSSGEELPKEAKQKRIELYSKVAKQLDDIKKDLRAQILKTATASAELERAQMIVAQLQRQIDEMTRMQMQTELVDIVATSSQLKPAAGAQSITSSPAGTRAPADYVLRPDDFLLIRAKGALSDGPIENSFRVDTMGTVALGPQYGSVKVEGLNVGQAQNEIRRKLGEFAFTPDGLTVQTEIVSWRGGASSSGQSVSGPGSNMKQELEKLQHRLSVVESENAELKKQLQEKTSKASKIPR
jgi:RNA polymerase sigma factor (sigma-70 family)